MFRCIKNYGLWKKSGCAWVCLRLEAFHALNDTGTFFARNFAGLSLRAGADAVVLMKVLVEVAEVRASCHKPPAPFEFCQEVELVEVAEIRACKASYHIYPPPPFKFCQEKLTPLESLDSDTQLLARNKLVMSFRLCRTAGEECDGFTWFASPFPLLCPFPWSGDLCPWRFFPFPFPFFPFFAFPWTYPYSS